MDTCTTWRIEKTRLRATWRVVFRHFHGKLRLLYGIFALRCDSGNSRLVREDIVLRIARPYSAASIGYQRQQLRLEAFTDLEQSGELAFVSDGVVANWELVPFSE